MRVLVACEFSGIVRDAFRALGHDAWSCDLLPTESRRYGAPYYWHHQCDVCELFDGRMAHSMRLEGQGLQWDLMIAHPPCTYLAKSGVRWLVKGTKGVGGINRERWAKMVAAADFFRYLLEAPVKRIAIENPMMHGYANREIFGRDGRKPDQIIQPFQFGDPEWKTTCLWLKNLVPLKPTQIVKPEERLCGGKRPGRITSRIHRLPPGPERQRERSKTFKGIAQAMAWQWGGLGTSAQRAQDSVYADTQ